MYSVQCTVQCTLPVPLMLLKLDVKLLQSTLCLQFQEYVELYLKPINYSIPKYVCMQRVYSVYSAVIDSQYPKTIILPSLATYQ